MNEQVKAALIGAIAAILVPMLFMPLGTAISHYLFPESVPVLASFGPDKESPQMTEKQINWTAAANDPRKEAFFYKFNLKGPSTNYTWEIVQNWETHNQWSWYPTNYDKAIDKSINQIVLWKKQQKE
jgi:hypothetical protein